jgi:hypothetical protein
MFGLIVGFLGGLLDGILKGGLGSLVEGVFGKDNPFSQFLMLKKPTDDVLSNVTNLLSSIIGGGK